MADEAGSSPRMRPQRAFTLLFLGTGAADWPAEVPSGHKADHDWRRPTSLLVNGRMLIDCGPALPEAAESFGVDPGRVGDVLLTHSHADHLSIEALSWLVEARGGEAVRLWGHAGALAHIPGMEGVDRRSVEVGQVFQVGSIRVEPLTANHWVDGGEVPLHFLVRGEVAQWLYAVDGSWLRAEVWARLRDLPLDAIVVDATIGEEEGDHRIFTHNSLPMIRHMVRTLRRQEMLKVGGQIFLSHLARQLHGPHSQIAAPLAKEGLVVARDGLYVHIHDIGEEAE